MLASYTIDLSGRTGLYAILVASVLGMMAVYPRPEGINLFTNWKKNFMSFLGGLGISIEFIVAILSFPFICAWFSRSKVVCLGLFYVAMIAVAQLFFTDIWELGVVAGMEHSTTDHNPPKEAGFWILYLSIIVVVVTCISGSAMVRDHKEQTWNVINKADRWIRQEGQR